MADSTLWLEHLSSSLRASRQLAYLYHVERDEYEFIGDVMGVLGIAEDEYPKNKEDFKKLIAPDEIVTRQIEIADAIHRSKSGETSFTLHYELCSSDQAATPIVETGIVRHDTLKNTTTIQSLMALDTEKIEQRKRLVRKQQFRNSAEAALSGNEDRRYLMEDLERIMEQKNDSTKEGATDRGYLLLVGMDRMSLVNEIYGTSFADDLIAEVKKRLIGIMSERGKVFHVTGDVFAILFEKDDPGEMNITAQNILTIFYNQPLLVHDRPVHQIISMGGVRLSEAEISPSSILSRAELALHDAKERGRGCFVEYSEGLGKEVQSFKEVLNVGDEFLRGFKENRVKMAFQGVINSRTKNVSFYETLIRMIDEKGEIHSAGRFIPAIEKMGLTRLVDTFATREAIRELKEFKNISLSVNVSNHTFTDPEWLSAVTMELRDHPEVAQRLIVEITESVVMSDINQTTRVIRVLQDLGCRIALDDFGAGQTAFTQLKDLSLDIVKIDKSFVRDMDKEENQLFIRTLHSLASAMNLETVGEGAETEGEADTLIKDGIDHIQGYVYSIPTLDHPWLKKNSE